MNHEQLLAAIIAAQYDPATFAEKVSLALEIAFRNGKAEALKEQLEKVSA